MLSVVDCLSFLIRVICGGRPVHQFVHDGDDEGIEEGRCEQASQDDFRHRTLYFVARQIAAQGKRNQCQCR